MQSNKWIESELKELRRKSRFPMLKVWEMGVFGRGPPESKINQHKTLCNSKAISITYVCQNSIYKNIHLALFWLLLNFMYLLFNWYNPKTCEYIQQLLLSCKNLFVSSLLAKVASLVIMRSARTLKRMDGLKLLMTRTKCRMRTREISGWAMTIKWASSWRLNMQLQRIWEASCSASILSILNITGITFFKLLCLNILNEALIALR